MLLWSVLALFALGAVSDDTVTTETSSQPTTTPDAVKDPEPIPYSNGSGQVFKTSDELIQSYRRQQAASPELPAVISSGQQLPTKIPSKDLEPPLETIAPGSTINSSGSTISSSGSTISTPGTTISTPGTTISTPGTTISTPGTTISTPGTTISTLGTTISTPGTTIRSSYSTISSSGSTISTPGSTPGLVPPRPSFNRSLHLRDELTVPSSEYTEIYDISWHAETNTAVTVVVTDGGPSTFIFRIPQADDQVQFLKNDENRTTGTVQRICTKSSSIPASPKDKAFPGLPDIEPFQFVGYTNEEGRQVERWHHVLIGKPGEAGAVQGESVNITHDFYVYRDGGDAVPLRYTVVTDSSILGPFSDSYTHRYRLLPAPTGPILPDTAPMCNIWDEYEPERGRREKPPQNLDAKELEDILTPTLL